MLIEAGQGTAANGNVRITTPGHEWKFNANGTTTLPSGNTIPSTSLGAAGDVAGMIAFNNTYIYYCTASYDGNTNIWKRVALSADTW